MKQELQVYVTNDTKFEEIYGNGDYRIILKFVPYYSIQKKQKEALEKLLSKEILKITIEEVEIE